jgi:glucosamine--fructose-6-phosphate aminotransferase (isomerizing)
MCGIFGQVAAQTIHKSNFDSLVKHSEQRGQDSSGLIYLKDGKYYIERADYNVEKLLNKVKPYQSKVALGHSRLITNGLADNQPVIKDNIVSFTMASLLMKKKLGLRLSLRENSSLILNSSLL